jgi:hypothetical protein
LYVDNDPAAANAEVLQRSLGRGQVRSREEITAFFYGLDLVQPGVVFLPEWRPDTVLNDAAPGGPLMLCGVARKP